MAHQILSIQFEADAQNHTNGQITIPKGVCDLLDLASGDLICLRISSHAGTRDFQLPLSSGTEVYGDELRQHVNAGEKLIIIASKDPLKT